MYKQFVFASGRHAHFLLGMNPKDVTEKDAVRAFCPYLLGKYLIERFPTSMASLR